MFEQNQKEVEALMQSNAEFRSLYQRHKELDSKVRDAELGVLPMDDVTLHNMRRPIPIRRAAGVRSVRVRRR